MNIIKLLEEADKDTPKYCGLFASKTDQKGQERRNVQWFLEEAKKQKLVDNFNFIEIPNSEHPDVIFKIDQLKVGVEITELIDENRRELFESIEKYENGVKNKKPRFVDYWDIKNVLEKFHSLITSKNIKYQKKQFDNLDELWLLIVSDDNVACGISENEYINYYNDKSFNYIYNFHHVFLYREMGSYIDNVIKIK